MFAIAPYIFQVVDLKKIPQDLASINGKHFSKILSEYFASILGVRKNNPPTAGGLGRMFLYDSAYLGAPGSVAGRYKTGEYGYESELFDSSTGKIAHHRTVDQAEMMPFHFSFYMPISVNPGDRHRGLLLLSRFNTHGIRGMVAPDLINYFAKSYPGLELKIERFVPEKLVSAFMKTSKVKKIRLIRNQLPKDLANVLSGNDLLKVQDFECIIRPKRKSYFDDVDWALKFLDTKFDPKTVFTLGEFTPDRVKIEMVNGATKRTVDLGNIGKISSNVILDNVKAQADGYLSAEDWLREADLLADEVFLSWDVLVPKWKSGA